jgi:hypothetical protein
MECELIDWPVGLNVNADRVFDIIPFIGVGSRIVRKAKRILRDRTMELVMAEWSKVKFPQESVVRMLRLIKILSRDYANWPNDFFMPFDIAAIPFCSIRGMCLDVDDIIEPFCYCYGVDKTEDFPLAIDIIDNGRLVELLEFLEKHQVF